MLREQQTTPRFNLANFQQGRSDFACWEYMCRFLLRALLRAKSYEDKLSSQPVSRFATVSDIAFVRLVMENNWERWSVEVQYTAEQLKAGQVLPKPKWTVAGHVPGDFNQGWSEEGRDRFNELCAFEANDRLVNAKVDDDIMAAAKEREEGKKKKVTRVREVTKVAVYMDGDSDED